MSCPACVTGAIHEGTPTGITTVLHGLPTYVAEPASGRPAKGIVVIVPDAFGWEFVNIRLMADNMARKKDYRVYLPDFMTGKPASMWLLNTMKGMSANTTWRDMLARPYHLFWLIYGLATFAIPNRFGVSFPRVKGFLENLRHNEAAHLPIGVTGYCWGGKHVLLLAENYKANGKPLMDAGYACHPSMVSFYSDFEKIKAPVAFGVGDKDVQFPASKIEPVRKIIEAFPENYKGEMKVYEGYGHGFGCRIDPINEDPKAADDAEDQGLSWFEKHFEKVSY